MIEERQGSTFSGYTTIVVLFALQIIAVLGIAAAPPMLKLLFGVGGIIVFICWFGFFMVAPNQGRVMQLFGKYVGSERQEGLRWANPLYMKAKVSLRVRNFESGTLKVNDSNGNPIDIAAVVVWKVVDTAEALFEVDDYENYVHIQSEAALRNLATTHPYDSHDDEGTGFCLRSNPEDVAELLKTEVQNRLSKAGVDVIEARISHLAYSPEIANAMLQRQQASAIVAARKKIVEGAVGMVELALEALSEKNVVQLDEERKAAMVSNLLVVLCAESSVTPVVNAGSLYT
ncbi:MAG: SPFH domain-containing protein [Proteobacteria bacterium]|nr:SPFH domain-containing protein [Pseudomonadota bacterium]